MNDKGVLAAHNIELVVTGDGSHSLFVKSLNEHYHSINGAVTESIHVFVEAGFEFVSNRFEHINVLEVGLGTGLNALLIMHRAEMKRINIHYTGIEPFPPDDEILKRLNYNSIINHPHIPELWEAIHYKARWMKEFRFPSGSSLLKWKGRAEDYNPTDPNVNLVCFDAFAPDVNPDLWELPLFLHIAAIVVKGGVLVTYSSKGSVRRALKSAGFNVEKIPGPAGKREMVRAIKM